MPRNPEEDRLSPEEREDRERQMTHAPDAMRLVPVEPTAAMIEAGRDAAQSAHAHHSPWKQEARAVYDAMLAAIATQPAPSLGVVAPRNAARGLSDEC